jgi:hypothetical protein
VGEDRRESRCERLLDDRSRLPDVHSNLHVMAAPRRFREADATRFEQRAVPRLKDRAKAIAAPLGRRADCGLAAR